MTPKIPFVFWPIMAVVVFNAIVLMIVVPPDISRDDDCRARGDIPANGRNLHVCLDPG